MESGNGWRGAESFCRGGVSAVFVNFGFLSHALMPKSACFDFTRARGDAVQFMEIRIRNYFNGLQSFLIQVGIVLGFFSFPDLHGITVVRINIFGLVGKQNSETDVCLNVMFVAEAVLTF